MSRRLFTALLTGMIICFSAVAVVFAAGSSPSAGILQGLSEAQGEANLPQYNSTEKPLPVLAGQIIGYALSFAGIVFFILSLYGGFLWMTSRGNSDQAEKGKETLIACTIGIIIIAGSSALTDFVLTSVQSNKKLDEPIVYGNGCSTDGSGVGFCTLPVNCVASDGSPAANIGQGNCASTDVCCTGVSLAPTPSGAPSTGVGCLDLGGVCQADNGSCPSNRRISEGACTREDEVCCEQFQPCVSDSDCSIGQICYTPGEGASYCINSN